LTEFAITIFILVDDASGITSEPGHHSYGLNNDISWPEIDENGDIESNESNESLSGPNMDEAWHHGLVLHELGNGRFSRLGTFEITKYYAGAYGGPTDSEADIPARRSRPEKQQNWFQDRKPEVLTIE
jgi:hypothetical protein